VCPGVNHTLRAHHVSGLHAISLSRYEGEAERSPVLAIIAWFYSIVPLPDLFDCAVVYIQHFQSSATIVEYRLYEIYSYGSARSHSKQARQESFRLLLRRKLRILPT
jgi:hypothetical protein